VDRPLTDADLTGGDVRTGEIDRYAYAHDASHYLLVPEAVVIAENEADVARTMRWATANGRTVTFRSGGTSLSGQAVSGGVLIDTRRAFSGFAVGGEGAWIRSGPGATVRAVNARLARSGRKFGPDPASEIACTIGGVIANNSSGMTCGVEQNTYRTIQSLRVILADGTELDTGTSDATERLREKAPELYDGLLALRDRLRRSPEDVERVTQLFSRKNTMGYGVNAFLDFDDAADILTHLLVGSEGTLGFIAEATFATVEVLPFVATALLVFPNLSSATDALPAIVATGPATVELMDAASLTVAKTFPRTPRLIADLRVVEHCALLVEFRAESAEALSELIGERATALAHLTDGSADFTTEATEREDLWRVRKGLYAAVAGVRPSGTTALLEDIVVPIDQLRDTCEALTELFAEHGYDQAVIFGHAKDGNLHFMLTELFDTDEGIARYRAFTEDLVDLVLAHGGSLKAEHGTGRVMAPFVRRQYGDTLYALMRDIKKLFDPAGILNPGVIISDDAEEHLRNLKVAPGVESEVDRCVECGYCEPVCPSRNLTLTPRQRIVLRRESTAAHRRGELDLAAALDEGAEYELTQTCAVDGMCQTACPVSINTGDLVRRLRSERENRVDKALWNAAAANWAGVSRIGSLALTTASFVPRASHHASVLARAVLGADRVPRYDIGLPRGGPRRSSERHGNDQPAAVLFSACVGSMFGPEPGGPGATTALERLAAQAGVQLIAPPGLEGLCCGTPWKSKGHLSGYDIMVDKVVPAIKRASDNGRLPVVCDASSCTEGLRHMLAVTAPEVSVIDATVFAAEQLLPALRTPTRLASLAVHRTCSSTAVGADRAIATIADAIAEQTTYPENWGCCAFAGDRGLLHPELSKSATRAEATELLERTYDAFASTNRTCEIGLSRATGKPFRHILELLYEAVRVPPPPATTLPESGRTV
jgi:D-lactate dehydrogenase